MRPRRGFVPLAFLPGEAFQFDWSEDWARSSRASGLKLQVAHVKLSYVAAPSFSAPILQQTHEMLFDAHNHAFRVFGACRGGASTTICAPRSTRSAAEKERQVNARFSAMVSDFLFAEAEFCNPASGWDRSGQIYEKNVVQRTLAIGSGSPCRTSPL